MDLKLSKNKLRFRITKEEREHLLVTNNNLQCTVNFTTEHYLTFEVITIDKENEHTTLSLKSSENKISLLVSKQALNDLKLPSKDGLESKQKELTLILEVDLRKTPAYNNNKQLV